jgi:hypothetical protein
MKRAEYYAKPIVTATDNYNGFLEVNFTESSVMTCADKGTVLHTWTAVDGCLNGVSFTQTIHIDDGTPVIQAAPASELLEYGPRSITRTR